jgi:O-antigen/teichoic acid export membrane protein/glycosyltransferase involved in cell wall biosynthesis
MKKLGRHTFIYTTGIAVAKAFSILLLPLYTHYLKPADVGVLMMLSVTTDLSGIILGCGLSSAMLRYRSKYDSEKDKREVVSSAVTFSVLAAAICVIIALAFNRPLSRLVLGDTRPLFSLAMEMMFISTFLELSLAVPLDFMRARERVWGVFWVTLARTLANLLLTIYLIAGLKMGFMGAIWANVAISGIVAPALLIYALRLTHGVHLSWDKTRRMALYGLPIIPALLALFVMHKSSNFFIRSFLGLDEVGIYGIGYPIAFLIQGLIGSSFGQVWGWMRFEVIKRDDGARIFARTLTYLMAATVFFALLLAVLAWDVLRLLADKSYWSASAVIPTIALGYICYTTDWVANSGPFIREKTLYRTYVVFAAVLLNIALNFLLVPRLGIQGAALATSIPFCAMFLVNLQITGRMLAVSWEYGRLLLLLGLGTALWVASHALRDEFPGLWPGLPLRAAICLLFPIVLLLSGMFNEEIRRLRESASQVSPKRGPRVLLIAPHFPPDIHVAAVRSFRIAKYLPRLGWEVWVLALPSKNSESETDAGALASLPAERLVRVAPQGRTAAESYPDENNDSSRTCFANILRHIKRWVADTIGMRTQELLWVLPAYAAGKRLVKANHIDLIFSSCSPFTAHIIARLIQRKAKCHWIAEYRDPWSNNPWVNGRAGWQVWFRKQLEKRIIRHADCITLVNEKMRDYFVESAPYLDAGKVVASRHGFDPEQFDEARAFPVAPPQDRMVITHTGLLGGYRPPGPFLDALAQALSEGLLPRDKIELRLLGAVEELSDGKDLQQLISERGLGGVVKVLGAVSHTEAMAQQLASDLLLYLQTRTDGGAIFASAKIFEYIGAGRPILAVAEESAGTEVLRSVGGATIISPADSGEISQALGRYFASWRNGDRSAVPDPNRVNFFAEPAPTQALADIFFAALKESKENYRGDCTAIAAASHAGERKD